MRLWRVPPLSRTEGGGQKAVEERTWGGNEEPSGRELLL